MRRKTHFDDGDNRDGSVSRTIEVPALIDPRSGIQRPEVAAVLGEDPDRALRHGGHGVLWAAGLLGPGPGERQNDQGEDPADPR